MALSTYQTPGIYVEEIPGGPRPIQAVGTSTAGFVGEAPNRDARVDEAVAINNWSQFIREFVDDGDLSTPLSHAVYGFVANGGRRCFVVNVGAGGTVAGGGRERRGVDVLAPVDEVAIVAAPGYTDATSHDALLTHCETAKDRVAILDSPEDVADIGLLVEVETAAASRKGTDQGSPPPAAHGCGYQHGCGCQPGWPSSTPVRRGLRRLLLPLDHRPGSPGRRSRQCRPLRAHGGHLGAHRRHAGGPQGPRQRVG